MTACSNCHGTGTVTDYSQQHRISGNYVGHGQKPCPSCGGSGLSRRARHGEGCFPASTLVYTLNGKTQIENLRPFDRVLSYNHHKKSIEEHPILRIVEYHKRQIWEIDTLNGEKLRTTHSHSFWSKGAWHRASEIKPGDTLATIDQDGSITNCQVVMSRPLDQWEDVFKIVVDKNFTMIADGFLAHSFTNFRSLQILYWKALRLASIDIQRYIRVISVP